MLNNTPEYIEKVKLGQLPFKDDNVFEVQLMQFSRINPAMLIDYTNPVIMAFIKELCLRKLGLDAYDTQILAAIRLFEGSIIEMKTGEGKTLAALMATVLHVFTHHKVHIVTANDYLAQRDYAFAKPVFEALGFSCGCMTNETTLEDRIAMADNKVIYTTNKEIAINYSNNRKAVRAEELVPSSFDVLIVDEADLLMIDEARKELSVGNNYEVDQTVFEKAQAFVALLEEADYKTNPHRLEFYLTESGSEKVESFYGVDKYHHKSNASIRNAIRLAFVADKFYKKDINYIVKDNELVLINTQTGRLMNFYKMLNGLQQALECKEGLPLSEARLNFTKVPYQFIFNQYKSKAGMTGTAMTEAKEFKEIYQMDVVEIPTNKPSARIDMPDRLFATSQLRDEAVVALVHELHLKGQPVLIGTASIEHSEVLAECFKAHDISFNLLNAKHHEQEAIVIQNAGRVGAVTIATNMAGRGTDIKVPDEALELGGLFILGTERYASRRADNQLRGRTGRQGDIGKTQFFTSLEDEVIHSLNVNRIKQLLMLLKDVEKKNFIENPTILNLYNKAQIALEGQHYDERKQMLSNNAVVLNYYQNYFNRKLFLMRSDMSKEQLLEKLLQDHVKDKEHYAKLINEDMFQQVDNTKHTRYQGFETESFYGLFNQFWVEFMNQLEMLGVNLFLNFSAIGNQELLYEKKVNELYGRTVLALRIKLIQTLQDIK